MDPYRGNGSGATPSPGRRRPVVLMTCIAVALGTPAAADGADAAASAASGGIEEIVVTARKREETAGRVPEAVAAFPGATIERAGITGVSRLNQLVPAFAQIEAQDPGANFITVRGITQVRLGEPSVAFVVDGVQASSPDQGTPDLYDVERVEVLKGPQGATYGRNAIGGAINIVTRAPPKDFEHELFGELAQGAMYRLRAGSSGPILRDRLLYRVHVGYRRDEGQYRNVTLDRKVDGFDEFAVRGKLLYLPTDRLTFDLRASHSNLDGGSSWYANIVPPDGTDSRAPIVGNRAGRGRKKITSVSLKIDYELGGATLTSISAVDDVFAATLDQDIDFLPWPLSPTFPGIGLDQTRDVQSFSEELRLTSNGGGALQWLLGVYYLHTDRDVSTRVFLDLDTQRGPFLSDISEANRNDAYAVFGTLDYAFAESWRLSLGLRQDCDERRQRNPVTGSRVAANFARLQPKVALSFFPADGHMIYASAGRGFRSGGFNAESPLFPRKFRAETADTVELGAKTAWLGRRLTIDGAVFHTRGRHAETFRFDGTTGTQGILGIERTRFSGVEASLRATLSRNLDLHGGFALLDTKIRDYDGTALYRGNPIPLVNEKTWSLGLEFHAPLDVVTLRARVDYNAFGDMAWHVDNVDRRGTIHVVNARAGVDAETWSVFAYVDNAFDGEYNTDFDAARFTGTPLDIAFPGRKRRVGMTASLRF